MNFYVDWCLDVAGPFYICISPNYCLQDPWRLCLRVHFQLPLPREPLTYLCHVRVRVSLQFSNWKHWILTSRPISRSRKFVLCQVVKDYFYFLLSSFQNRPIRNDRRISFCTLNQVYFVAYIDDLGWGKLLCEKCFYSSYCPYYFITHLWTYYHWFLPFMLIFRPFLQCIL